MGWVLGQAEARSWSPRRSPMWVTGPQIPGDPPLLSQLYQHGARPEVTQAGLEPERTQNASTARNG